MSLCNCECRFGCVTLGFIASLIIGIITAFLQITAVITVTPAFLWVTLGVAVVYLAANLFSSSECNVRGCCVALSAVLAGILGTALLSVILLAIPFAATSVIGAIFTGLLLFFFSLILTSTACLIKCKANCD